MRIRYLSYIVLGVMAVFLVVATQVFSLSTVESIALGMGIAMLIVSLSIAGRFRGDVAALFVGTASALVSAWIILATQVFSSLQTVSDVSFYSAMAVGVLTLGGLTAHELRVERVVHSLEVRSGEAQPEPVDGRPLAA
jgi:hypothetical protein